MDQKSFVVLVVDGWCIVTLGVPNPNYNPACWDPCGKPSK